MSRSLALIAFTLTLLTGRLDACGGCAPVVGTVEAGIAAVVGAYTTGEAKIASTVLLISKQSSEIDTRLRKIAVMNETIAQIEASNSVDISLIGEMNDKLIGLSSIEIDAILLQVASRLETDYQTKGGTRR